MPLPTPPVNEELKSKAKLDEFSQTGETTIAAKEPAALQKVKEEPK